MKFFVSAYEIFFSEFYQLISTIFQTLASSLLAAVSGQYLGYAGYPYAAHAIVGLKSAPCVNAANVPVPCAAGYYGKIIIIQFQYSYSISQW